VNNITINIKVPSAFMTVDYYDVETIPNILNRFSPDKTLKIKAVAVAEELGYDQVICILYTGRKPTRKVIKECVTRDLSEQVVTDIEWRI